MLATVYQRLAESVKEPFTELRCQRSISGKKMIGCFPMDVPEEIIHAAGMTPITLLPNGGPSVYGKKHLLPFTCEEIWSTYEMLVSGKLSFFDGFVVPLICDQLRFYSDLWDMEAQVPLFHQMWLSFRMDDMGRKYLVTEFERLRFRLEAYLGESISGESIKESILVYNKRRLLLGKLGDLSKFRPGILSFSELVTIVTSGMLMDIVEHNSILEEILHSIENKEGERKGKAEVLLIGHPCWPPSREFLNMMDGLGIIVVGDDLYTGRRYFDSVVSLEGDPIEALANHYFEKLASPIKHYPAQFKCNGRIGNDYTDMIISMYRKSGAKGVINLGVMYCDPYDLEYPYLRDKVEKEEIPLLNISGRHDAAVSGDLKTRIGAFVEMIEK